MGPVEERQGGLPAGQIDVAYFGQRFVGVGRFRLEFAGFGLVRGLVDGARQIGVQEAVLHGRQLGLPLGQGRGLPLFVARQVARRCPDCYAEPIGDFGVRHSHFGQIVDNGLLQIFGRPPDAGVVGAGLVVRTPIIRVLAHPAALELAANLLPRDRLAAVRAPEQASGKRDVRRPGSSVSAVHDVLAGVEGGPVNQASVSALEDLAVAVQFADVEAVAEDVRQCRAIETGHALAKYVSLAFQLIRKRLERVGTRRVEFEHANQRPRPFGVRLDRFVAVVHVDVAVGGEARRPALADLLVHPLQDFRPEVVGVVLGHGGHHVERQGARGARPELVVNEGQLDPAGILEFLQANGVPHVAADAIELVAEDRLDLQALRIGLDPREHLVEGDPFRPAFGRFGHDELADHIPAVRLGSLAVHAELCIDRIPLSLLAG